MLSLQKEKLLMKKLHLFIIRSFIGPFILTFFIAIFILLMQFLWKYVDDLVGKGLEWYIILELLFYTSASLVPLALPLAILISSIMTFGNLGEYYELVALKSAGISLQRIMFPLTILIVFISISAFYFSNNVLPYTNLKMGSLLYDVRQQKPTLDIKPGIFYKGIEGYVIRIGKKSSDGKTIEDIMINAKADKDKNSKVIVADSGKMEFSNDKRFLNLVLINGNSYQETESRTGHKRDYEFLRTAFKEEVLRFDLSSFQLNRSDEDLFKDNYQMLNVKQLQEDIDTMGLKIDQRKEELLKQFYRNYHYKKTKEEDQMVEPKSTMRRMRNRMTWPNNEILANSPDSTSPEKRLQKTRLDPKSFNMDILQNFNKNDQETILVNASNMARTTNSFITSMNEELNSQFKTLNRYKVEWHRKFTLSFACVLLFFIGAPLGAIIRKGGLGMPLVVSVGFFILFHVLSITGEKFVKEGLWEAFNGMWLSSFVLLPIGIFLVYKSTRDSVLFDLDSYKTKLLKVFKR
jgi:lipopolysaccharide export system permease protein